MGWETYDETRTCGSLGTSQASANGVPSPALGTVLIPANTAWEVVHIQGRSVASGGASGPGVVMLRDSANTANIYGALFVPDLAQATKGNNSYPIGATIGPFTGDVTLEVVAVTPSTDESNFFATALFRLLQSYD